jgi:hypothetical protein
VYTAAIHSVAIYKQFVYDYIHHHHHDHHLLLLLLQQQGESRCIIFPSSSVLISPIKIL